MFCCWVPLDWCWLTWLFARLQCRYPTAVDGIALSCWLATTYCRTRWLSMRRWNSSAAHTSMRALTQTRTVKCSLAVRPSGSTRTLSGQYVLSVSLSSMLVLRDLRAYTTSHRMKQSTWPRTALCRGRCLRMVISTPSGACQKRWRRMPIKMHYGCLVWDWIAKIKFDLRPNLGLRLWSKW